MHDTSLRARFARMLPVILLFAALLPAIPALAHDHEHGASPTPVSAEDLGKLSFPTSTHSPAAQAAFERGMLWLHLFEYDYAADAFRQAEKLDPGLALAYWGEAMTHTHAIWNQDAPDAARAALAKLAPTPAARAAKAGSEKEKAFLDTGEQEFGPGSLKERDTRFLAATKALADRYPDDDEAQLLHALALLGISRGERNVSNYLAAAGIARKVLARNPMHPGAAHYWIHGMDDPAHAEGALEAARALSRIAPGAGHAQHMVSHIFMALGMWNDVVLANERAMQVINAQARSEGRTERGCFHYSEWLQYAYYQLGRQHDGQRQLAECERLGAQQLAWMMLQPDRSAKTTARFQQQWLGSFVSMRATSVVESAQDRAYDSAMVVDITGLGRQGGWDAFARGYAAAQDGDVAAARNHLASLQAFVAQADAADGSDEHTTDYLGIMADMLQGLVDAKQGRGEAGIARVQDAARKYEALPYDFGPPVPVKPPRELAGELLLQLRRPKEALVEFNLSLKTTPRRVLSMLGRARAFAASGDAVAAKQAYSDLLSIWTGADTDLPDLAEVRAGATQTHVPSQ